MDAFYPSSRVRLFWSVTLINDIETFSMEVWELLSKCSSRSRFRKVRWRVVKLPIHILVLGGGGSRKTHVSQHTAQLLNCSWWEVGRMNSDMVNCMALFRGRDNSKALHNEWIRKARNYSVSQWITLISIRSYCYPYITICPTVFFSLSPPAFTKEIVFLWELLYSFPLSSPALIFTCISWRAWASTFHLEYTAFHCLW